MTRPLSIATHGQQEQQGREMTDSTGSVVRVGHIDLSFHDASAREVEAILTSHGHHVERSAAPHEEMFQRMRRGEIDMLVSAWLPTSHGGYLRPFEQAVRKVTVLYEPYCIWGVPELHPGRSRWHCGPPKTRDIGQNGEVSPRYQSGGRHKPLLEGHH